MGAGALPICLCLEPVCQLDLYVANGEAAKNSQIKPLACICSFPFEDMKSKSCELVWIYCEELARRRDSPWEPEQQKYYLWKWVIHGFGGTHREFSSGAIDWTSASYQQNWRWNVLMVPHYLLVTLSLKCETSCSFGIDRLFPRIIRR